MRLLRLAALLALATVPVVLMSKRKRKEESKPVETEDIFSYELSPE